MNYVLSPSTNIRNENFGAIIYNRFGSLSYVDRETRSFISVLRSTPRSIVWLMENCPHEFKDKLQEFVIWGLKKGYIEIDGSSSCVNVGERIVVERSISPNVYERLDTPITATIYPEYRCNQHCYFCFAQNNMKKNKTRLNQFEWEQIIEKCLDAQVTRLVILGGEPFINIDLLMAIIRKASPFIPITIFTNGTAGNGINNELVQELSCYTNVDLVFSIHSNDSQIHDLITGVPGSHKIALQSLKNICDYGTNIASVNCVMTPQNVDDILELAKKVAEIGAKEFAFTPANPCGLSSVSGLSGIAPNKVLNVFKTVQDWLIQTGCNMEITCDVPYATGAAKPVANYSGELVEMLTRPCVGDTNMIIDYDGGVYACNGVVGDEAYNIGNIKTYDIKKKWRSYIWPLARRKDYINEVVCEKCERKNSCYGGCPLLALNVLGSVDRGNPFCYKVNSGTFVR